MGTIYLGIPHSCLDSRSAFHRHMPKIVCYFFEGPASFTSTVGKIMPQIMKAEVSNEFPFFIVRLVFETTKPSMNTVFLVNKAKSGQVLRSRVINQREE
jgi:hypothetical protein